LPEYLKSFVTFAYKTGWRISEISELTWQQLDREQDIVRIETGETKNDKARTVYMDEELNEIVKQKWEARKRAEKLLPHIFFLINMALEKSRNLEVPGKRLTLYFTGARDEN
jgi:integrase